MIYTSPDGGHTVYTEVDGKRVLISEDAHARKRRRLGYLQQAITLADKDPQVMEELELAVDRILVYARLKGHDIKDWNENP